ncbi:MAG TPA: hypothetical protein VFC60_03205 [Tissierellaceae bacterium]|nr:hypothetical protein [Tissierellaceae bacterium]
MKYFIVMAKKEKAAYLWDYISNSYYEYRINDMNFAYQIEDVIELTDENYEILENSSYISFTSEKARTIGKTDLKHFINKMNIILGRQTTDFKNLLEQRKENRRIISLVEFSGSKIKNNQLRIKHKEDFSYCDLRDSKIKDKEGLEYSGLAIIEYIPGRKAERSYNLLVSLRHRLNSKDKMKSQKLDPNLIVTLEKNELLRIFSSNEKYFKLEDDLWAGQEWQFQEAEFQNKMNKRIEEEFILLPYGDISYEDSFEEYFDEEVLNDSVNDGFDDWENSYSYNQNSIDELAEDYYFEPECYTEDETDLNYQIDSDYLDSMIEGAVSNKSIITYFEENNEFNNLVRDTNIEEGLEVSFAKYDDFLEHIIDQSYASIDTNYFEVDNMGGLLYFVPTPENLENEKNTKNALKDPKENPHICILDRYLGKFKVYLKNDIDSSDFATNNEYILINYLNPDGMGYREEDLPLIKNLGEDILLKYFNKAKSILEGFKKYIPSINIVNIVIDDDLFF